MRKCGENRQNDSFEILLKNEVIAKWSRRCRQAVGFRGERQTRSGIALERFEFLMRYEESISVAEKQPPAKSLDMILLIRKNRRAQPDRRGADHAQHQHPHPPLDIERLVEDKPVQNPQ